MSKKNKDALLRSDRILVGVLAVVLAAASATVAATAAYHPYKDGEVATRTDDAPAPPAMLQTAKAEEVKSAVSQMAQDAADDDAKISHASSISKDVMEKLLREHRCLSEAMYYEARGEGRRGEKAVAEVVFHRLRTGHYGHSICAVVYEGAYRPGCQFTFTCNGMLNQPKNQKYWMRAQLLAAKILTGEEHLSDTTEGATSYHAVSVNPVWASELVRTVKIGNHVFYRRGASTSRSM